MAAGEDELEPLVGEGGLFELVLHGQGFRHLEQLGLGDERAVPADAVDRPVAGRRR